MTNIPLFRAFRGRLFPNGRFKFTLERDSDDEMIHADSNNGTWTIEITKIFLKTVIVTPRPEVMEALLNNAKNHPVISFDQILMTKSTASSLQNQERLPLMSGVKDLQLLIVWVSNNLAAKPKKNSRTPELFQEIGENGTKALKAFVSKIRVVIGDARFLPENGPIDPAKDKIDLYRRFLSMANAVNDTDRGPALSFEKFTTCNGFALFDTRFLIQEFNDGVINDIKLDLSFSNPVTTNTYSVVTAAFVKKKIFIQQGGKKLVLTDSKS